MPSLLASIFVLLASLSMPMTAHAEISAIEDGSYLWMTQNDELVFPQLDDPNYEALGRIYKDNVAFADDDVPVIGQEVEDTIAGKKLGEVPLPDVPMVLNQQVEKWMTYFQGRGRKYFALWLSRSSRYIPMMKQILRDNGLPEGLIYLSMIESGFRPVIYSRTKAVGPWQFMKFTGARYGLRANYWIDERMDPEKSTLAAAQHLKDLYDEFDHWYLAAAGYNAGAGKISRAMTRYRTGDFWQMSKYRYLKPETKNYVPKLLAASMLATDPVKYGFTDIQYEDPVPYSKVPAAEPVLLETVANALSISVDTLKDLNPELRRGVTPPDYPNYELKVPPGLEHKFNEAYSSMPRYKAEPIIVHNVRTGETLSRIAHKYGVSTASLMRNNNLKANSRLRRNQEILVAVNGDASIPKMDKAPDDKPFTLAAVDSQEYVVLDGDTLWKISRTFNVTVSQLRLWNNFGKKSSIRPGQKLLISNSKKTSSNVPQASLDRKMRTTQSSASAKNLAEWTGSNIFPAQLNSDATLASCCK